MEERDEPAVSPLKKVVIAWRSVGPSAHTQEKGPMAPPASSPFPPPRFLFLSLSPTCEASLKLFPPSSPRVFLTKLFLSCPFPAHKAKEEKAAASEVRLSHEEEKGGER